MKLKRTEYIIMVGITTYEEIYRTVLTDGKDYYIRYNKKLRNVNKYFNDFILK